MQCYTEYTRHMWRYYFANQHITVDMMQGAELQNWIACNTVYNRLLQSEQDILRMFFTMKKDKSGKYAVAQNVTEYANRNKLSVDYIWKTVNSAQYWAAVERGLIDRKGRK